MRARTAVAALIWLVAAPGAGAATWSVQPTPAVPGSADTELAGVSCGGVGECVAVGFQTRGARPRALAERWNGSKWSLTSTPGISGSRESALTSVPCSRAGWCEAIGDWTDPSGREHPLAEHWSGAHWTRQAVPDPSAGQATHLLTGVSCPTRSFCLAVGYFGQEHFSPYYSATFQGLVLRWNGHHWKVAKKIHAASGVQRTPTAVSCASPSNCMAVGGVASGSIEGVPLGWWFDGRHWSNLHPPNPAEASGLLGVSCLRGRWCMAAGHQFVSRDQTALAERWNGHGWQVAHPPRPAAAGGADLASVSCRSARLCTAAGASGPADPTGGLAEGWDGGSWTIEPTPGGDGWPLSSVSCRPGLCEAVGTHAGAALAERLG